MSTIEKPSTSTTVFGPPGHAHGHGPAVVTPRVKADGSRTIWVPSGASHGPGPVVSPLRKPVASPNTWGARGTPHGSGPAVSVHGTVTAPKSPIDTSDDTHGEDWMAAEEP